MCSTVTVTEAEVVDHGIHHEQYFQGCGVSFTRFTSCFTGCGMNHNEAFEDAIEQAVCNGMDEESLDAALQEHMGPDYSFSGKEGQEDHYYYVSIRIR